jgi:hypothetical protein
MIKKCYDNIYKIKLRYELIDNNIDLEDLGKIYYLLIYHWKKKCDIENKKVIWEYWIYFWNKILNWSEKTLYETEKCEYSYCWKFQALSLWNE